MITSLIQFCIQNDRFGDVIQGQIACDQRCILTGDLDADLATAVGTMTFRFQNRPVRALFRGTLAASTTDDAHTAPMSDRYIEGFTAPVRDVITRAVEAGELDGDPEELTSTLCGPILFDHLLLGRPVDEDACRRRTGEFLARHRTD